MFWLVLYSVTSVVWFFRFCISSFVGDSIMYSFFVVFINIFLVFFYFSSSPVFLHCFEFIYCFFVLIFILCSVLMDLLLCNGGLLLPGNSAHIRKKYSSCRNNFWRAYEWISATIWCIRNHDDVLHELISVRSSSGNAGWPKCERWEMEYY